MAVSTNWVMRQYRWLRPRHNSPARRWDRVEAAVALACLVLSLLAVPMAVLVGAAAHTRELSVAAAQRADRHPASAVLITGTPPDAVSDIATVSQRTETAVARWQLADGTERTGTIDAEAGLASDTTVPIWLNSAGDVVNAPMSAANASAIAFGFGALLWATATVALLLGYWAVRLVLDRRRAAEWAREWESVSWKPGRTDS